MVLFQVLDLSRSRERARQEVKEKEEEKQQMKEGLKVALEEMMKLKLLLQVQHLLLVSTTDERLMKSNMF